ncbi:hypothetical protein WJX75_001209 [Coccomyxa subellipsoidea]|uniref:Uncharacterized protein n=1 Tax=Coccomyxa subellipsoidea TaxID=248742 RepID=A0ABR2YKC1_9CHLO
MFANAQSIDKKEAPKFASNLEALADEDNTCRSALHLLSNFALESCRSSNLLGSGITRDSGARPELTAASVRSTDPVTGQPVSLDSSTPRAMPAAPQQAGPNAPTPGPESGTGASGQSGLLALNGTGAGGGMRLHLVMLAAWFLTAPGILWAGSLPSATCKPHTLAHRNGLSW